MLRRLRENGPIVLVPAAWTFAIAAHRGLLASRTVLIAHLVMDAIMVAFVVLSWNDMTDGVLLAWRRVVLVGVVLTSMGVLGLLLDPISEPLLIGTVLGWLIVPAAALAYTGRRVDRYPMAYLAGAALSVLGAVGYALSLATGGPALQTASLAVAGVGQTAGIVAAVLAY